MSLTDEPIQLPEIRNFLRFPVLAGAGIGVFAAYGLFKSPSLAQVLGVSLLGGLGGYSLGGRAIGGAPEVSLPSPSGLGSAWDDLADRVAEIFKPPLPVSPPTGGTQPVNNIAPGGIMSAQTAYSLIQQGKYQTHVKFAKMSRYYLWRDCIEPILAPVGASRAKTVALSTYQNASRLATYLDLICDRTDKKKIAINSWIRIQTKSSFHTTGKAADLGGSLSFAYITTKVLRAARSVKDIHIGIPTNPGHRSLHIDIGDRRGAPEGKPQFTFIDNGSYGGGDKWNEILPPPGTQPVSKPAPPPTLNLFAPRQKTQASILPQAGSIRVAPAPAPRRLPYIQMPLYYPAPQGQSPQLNGNI